MNGVVTVSRSEPLSWKSVTKFSPAVTGPSLIQEALIKTVLPGTIIVGSVCTPEAVERTTGSGPRDLPSKNQKPGKAANREAPSPRPHWQ